MEDKIRISAIGSDFNELWKYEGGHPEYWYLQQKLIKLIASALQRYKVVECYSGMDSGASLLWTMSVNAASLHFGKSRVKFIAEIPSQDQCKEWPGGLKRLYKILYNRADVINHYSDKYEKFGSEAHKARDKHMIDNSDMIIFIWKQNILMGDPINQAYNYALKNDKKIFRIRPSDLKVIKDK